MITHPFHITSYDLATLVVIISGVNFALLLSFTRRGNRPANRFLALTLFVMVLLMARLWATDIGLPVQFSLALGPLIYFYVLKLTRPEYKFRWKDLLHFTPLALEQAILQNPALPLLAFISVIGYLYGSHRLIERYYRRQKFHGGDRYRVELRWLHKLLKAFGVIWLLWLPYAVVGYFYYHHQLSAQAYYPFYLGVAAMLTWIAVAAHLRLDASVAPVAPLFFKPALPAELKQRGAWLKSVVKENRYYEDPELSLSSLAEKLGLTTHELSRIINTALNKSFNDFINEYRVRDILRKMQDPAYDHFTLVGIAYESGFNSKTTFNRAFKQATGKNPVDYKNVMKEEAPSYNSGLPMRFAMLNSSQGTTQMWSRQKLNRSIMFKNYLKIAFRSFWKHKVFTLINIVGLSIGISAALVIYLIVHYDFTFDKFHKDSDRIYRVVTDMNFSGENIYNSGVTSPLPNVVPAEVTGLEASAPFFEYYNSSSIIIPGKTQSKFTADGRVTFADQRFFNLFTYKWLAGSAKTALSAPKQVVLTSQQAKKYFPRLSYDQMIGRQVVYNDTVRAKVTGIVKELEGNTDITFHDFVSYSTISRLGDMKDELTEWGGVTSASQFFVKLAPGSSPKHIEKQLNHLLSEHSPKHPGNKKNDVTLLRLQPLSDIHFNSNYGAINNQPANKTALYGLIIIAVFLLILGCINFINLTTAQASQRAKEIGIRKTMGSSRSQLIIQFLSETFMVTLLAVVAAAFMAPAIIKLFSSFISPDVKADFFHRPDLMLFLFGLAVLVSFLSGFYPALVLSRYKPVSVLKDQAFANSGKTRNAWLRKTLSVSQFVIAQFFIMATILVSKQIHYAIHTDLGFKKDAIIYINTPWNDKMPGHKQLFFNKVKTLSQIEMISIGQDAPSSDGGSSANYTYKDGKKEISTQVQTKSGDENYIKVYHLKLLAGRNISAADSAWRGIVINSTYAHLLGFKDVRQVVGKYLDKTQIVGVMADFHQSSLHTPIKPLGLQYINKYCSTIHIALKPQTADGNEWKQTIAAMEKTWKNIYPDHDFNYIFFDDTIAKLYTGEQHTSTLLTWATGVSILISCLGLLGLAMYTTTRRTKEIGVRKVLGASVAQIVRLLSAELVLLMLLAFVIVTPLAWWAMNKWMESYADKTTISWWIFAASGAGMLLTAFITSSFQTIKAAIVNPVNSLRNE